MTYSYQHLPAIIRGHKPRGEKQHESLICSSVGQKSRMGGQHWFLLKVLRDNPCLCLFQFLEAACFPRLLAPRHSDLCFRRHISFSVSDYPPSLLRSAWSQSPPSFAQTISTAFFPSYLFLFVWLCWVLVATHGIFLLWPVGSSFERLLLTHKKTPGFLASGEELKPGPETRLDRSELLCNKVLLKYKGGRESF